MKLLHLNCLLLLLLPTIATPVPPHVETISTTTDDPEDNPFDRLPIPGELLLTVLWPDLVFLLHLLPLPDL